MPRLHTALGKQPVATAIHEVKLNKQYDYLLMTKVLYSQHYSCIHLSLLFLHTDLFLFSGKLRKSVLGLGHYRQTPESHVSIPVKTFIMLGSFGLNDDFYTCSSG